MDKTLKREIFARLKRLASLLRWQHPFFGLALANCRFGVEYVGTACVDETGLIRFDPRLLAKLPDAEVIGVMAHEVCHPLYCHSKRRGTRNHHAWNAVTDMAINQILKESSIKLPEWVLYPPAGHEHLCAEALYDLLPKEQKNDSCDGQDERPKPGAGCGMDPAPGSDEAGEGQQGAASNQGGQEPKIPNWQQIAVQCAAVAGCGEGSADALRRLAQPPPSRSQWQQVLKHGCSRAKLAHGKDDHTWSRRSRRTQLTGPIYPGTCSYRAQVAILIDTSGSMSEDAIAVAAKQAVEIAEASGVKVWLGAHTSRCYVGEWVTGATLAKVAGMLTKTGGTSYIDAFEKIEASGGRFDYLIQLTDGECGWPAAIPVNCKKLIVALVGMRCRTYIPNHAEVIDIEVPK